MCYTRFCRLDRPTLNPLIKFQARMEPLALIPAKSVLPSYSGVLVWLLRAILLKFSQEDSKGAVSAKCILSARRGKKSEVKTACDRAGMGRRRAYWDQLGVSTLPACDSISYTKGNRNLAAILTRFTP